MQRRVNNFKWKAAVGLLKRLSVESIERDAKIVIKNSKDYFKLAKSFQEYQCFDVASHGSSSEQEQIGDKRSDSISSTNQDILPDASKGRRPNIGDDCVTNSCLVLPSSTLSNTAVDDGIVSEYPKDQHQPNRANSTNIVREKKIFRKSCECLLFPSDYPPDTNDLTRCSVNLDKPYPKPRLMKNKSKTKNLDIHSSADDEMETGQYLSTTSLYKSADDPADCPVILRSNSSATSLSSSLPTKPPAVRSNSSCSSLSAKEDRGTATPSHRQRRGALMVSCENLLADSDLFSSHDSGSLKGIRNRLHHRKSGIFSAFKSEHEKMDQLTELLNNYGQNGIPSSPTSLQSQSIDSEDDYYHLENNWQEIVENADSLPKRMQNQNDAIWELLQTEVAYIRRLKVITDLFLACLSNLQSECILNEIDTSKMFSNIQEVCRANCRFWSDHLLPTLMNSRANRQSFNPIIMKEGFLKFEHIFHPYLKYCLEHSTCLQYVNEKHKESELFKAYVVWCETRKDCERLRLTDLLVKPMQRLTKYSLLLKAILKKTDCEEQKLALKQMNLCVERFVCVVDTALRRQNEQEKLSSILNRIESYEAIESNNDEVERLLKDYSRLDLTGPMPGCGSHYIRQLFVEGSMKMKDQQANNKVDVHCFLFTDSLLVCKSINKKSDRVKVIRQPFLIDRIVTQELKDGSGFVVIYLNEYRLASAVIVFYSVDTKTWLAYLKKAQDQYKRIKLASISIETISPQEMGYFTGFFEEEDFDYPTTALLAASPRSSSRSSLVQSHSGSFDTSDPISSSSLTVIAPATTPNLLENPSQQPSRTVSFELGDLRNPSLTVDDGDSFGRSHSVDNRGPPPSVTITSPRPERRAFWLKNAKNNPYNTSSPNMLSVAVPYQVTTNKLAPPGSVEPNCCDPNLIAPPTIQIPVIPQHHSTSTNLSPVVKLPKRPPSPRTLSRFVPVINKPPLVKTKNVSGLILVNKVEGQARSLEDEEHHHQEIEFDENVPSTSTDEVLQSRFFQKRSCRGERRYHTADSYENMKKEKDASIHKRLSWNYGQHQHAHCSRTTSTGACHCDRNLCTKHLGKCPSNESVCSSSGFSSTASTVGSCCGSCECEQCSAEMLDHIEENASQDSSDAQTVMMSEAVVPSDGGAVGGGGFRVMKSHSAGTSPEHHPMASKIKIDVSEMCDGISSVRITLSGSNGKPSKADLKRMKEFLLSNYNVEASEV